MIRGLAVLLLAASVGAHAQAAPDDAQDAGYAGPYGEKHAQAKRREQIAIGKRVQQRQVMVRARQEAQYAENRDRCQAALQVAEQCGKFAGTFYCDEKGFRSIAADAAVKPVVLGNNARHRMEHCALDLVRPKP